MEGGLPGSYRAMRILIQGIGSIGQRHFKNAISLGIDVAILRSGQQQRPFVESFFSEMSDKGIFPKVFYNLETAIRDFNPDGLIVATPNNLHEEHAKSALQAGAHVLLEKPAALTPQGADVLLQLAEEKGVSCLIGYNLRFHPLLLKVKKMVATGDLGSVLAAHCEVGESIEDWHPWEDYKETYAPYVKTGGGSLLCFSHDIDYLLWILGKPSAVFAAGGKKTTLSGDAEDMVQALFTFPEGLTALLHVDYWQRPKVRTLKLIGTKKTILWDQYDGTLKIWDHETGDVLIESDPPGFERNSMFIDEIRHFRDIIECGVQPIASLHESKQLLCVVEDIKRDLVLKDI